MSNPWEKINLQDYESHMGLSSVMQLQAMNSIMNDQLYRYPVSSVMILGIAGGNGLNHVDPHRFKKICGVDVNRSYLEACTRRYPKLKGVFQPIFCDLSATDISLPRTELVIANLLIEYIGCESFQRVIKQVCPSCVSCVIQLDSDEGFVSDSPYLHTFDCLASVHRQISQEALGNAMKAIGYSRIFKSETELPNGKSLVRLDFEWDD